MDRRSARSSVRRTSAHQVHPKLRGGNEVQVEPWLAGQPGFHPPGSSVRPFSRLLANRFRHVATDIPSLAAPVRPVPPRTPARSATV